MIEGDVFQRATGSLHRRFDRFKQVPGLRLDIAGADQFALAVER
jgi:hypothetical protein